MAHVQKVETSVREHDFFAARLKSPGFVGQIPVI
jgi:hypothetical protein